jgi:hypothetical protein
VLRDVVRDMQRKKGENSWWGGEGGEEVKTGEEKGQE